MGLTKVAPTTRKPQTCGCSLSTTLSPTEPFRIDPSVKACTISIDDLLNLLRRRLEKNLQHPMTTISVVLDPNPRFQASCEMEEPAPLSSSPPVPAAAAAVSPATAASSPASDAARDRGNGRRSGRGGGRSNRRRQPAAAKPDDDANGNTEKPPTQAKKKQPAKANGKEAKSAATAVDAAVGKKPPTPVESLVEAIRVNDMDAFRAILLKSAEGLNVNTQRARDGDTALVEACRYARYEMASLLLREKNADVTVASTNKKANRQGLTPLVAACMTLDVELVDLLLQQEDPPVNLVHMYGRVNAIVVCVLFSVANGHTDKQAQLAFAILEKLLTYAKERGKLQDVFKFETEKGNRLVHIVAGLSNWRAVELLRSFGADFECINRQGKSPLRMVEFNAFERRSFAFCEPPKPDTKKKRGGGGRQQRRGGKGGQNVESTGAEETATSGEPESEAGWCLSTLRRLVFVLVFGLTLCLVYYRPRGKQISKSRSPKEKWIEKWRSRSLHAHISNLPSPLVCVVEFASSTDPIDWS